MRTALKSVLAALASVTVLASGVLAASPAHADPLVGPISGLTFLDIAEDGEMRLWYVTPPDLTNLSQGSYKVMIDISSDSSFAVTDILDNWDLTGSSYYADSWGLEWQYLDANTGSSGVIPNATEITVRMWIEVFDGVSADPVYSTPPAVATGSSTTAWGPISAARKNLLDAEAAHSAVTSQDRCPTCVTDRWDAWNRSDVDAMNQYASELDADSSANIGGYLTYFEEGAASGLEFHPGDWKGIFDYVQSRLQYFRVEAAREQMQVRVDALFAAAAARKAAVEDSWVQRDLAKATFSQLWNGESTELFSAVPENLENYQTADLVAKTNALKAFNLVLAANRVADFATASRDVDATSASISASRDALLLKLSGLPAGSARTELVNQVNDSATTSIADSGAAESVEDLITIATDPSAWAYARAQYDLLTSGAKAYVNNYQSLVEAEQQIAAGAAAAFDQLVDAGSWAEARTSYNAMSQAARSLATRYETLLDHELSVAASGVIALIAAKSWVAARSAYNALSSEAKLRVTNFALLTAEEAARASAVELAQSAMSDFISKGGRSTAKAYVDVRDAIRSDSTASSRRILDLTTALKATRIAPGLGNKAPALTGAMKVGKSVSTSAATWLGRPAPTITYQWYSCTKAVANGLTLHSGSGCTAILRATASNFTIGAALLGRYLMVAVKATVAAVGSVTYYAGNPTKVAK